MTRILFFILTLTFLGNIACGGAKPKTAAGGTPSPATKSQAVTPVPAPVEVPAAVPKAETAPMPPPLAGVDVDSPTVVIQKYTEELRKIVDLSTPKEQRASDTVRERKIADKVRQFFDFPGLAKMSLGTNWNKGTPAQREEYMDLFVGLIEDSYLRKTRDLVGDYTIVYGREEVNGNRAKVFSRVARRDADVEIKYELHKNPKNWMIFNIDLDGVDLIQNYQTQFNSIVKREGFAGLLAKLRKKKDEIQEEVTF